MTIAASTGGPPALAKVLGSLPADFPIPILLVQHMGAPFMEGFASWLDGITALDVAVAREQEIPCAGRVYVAPGDRHLLLSAAGTLQISASPPLASQRPSATVMFRSVAKVLGSKGLGVLLTGMGEDGAEGLVEMRRAGAYTIAEDETTAVVYGMPAAALRMGGVAGKPAARYDRVRASRGLMQGFGIMNAAAGTPGACILLVEDSETQALQLRLRAGDATASM